MKLSIAYAILLVILAACNNSTKNAGETNTTLANKETDSSDESEPGVEDARRDFIKLYNEPYIVDTFFIAANKKYRIMFRHYCTNDSALLVPAKYNFDTNKDFRTHNFASEIVLMAGSDTAFRKSIIKSLFYKILNPEEDNFGTLLYPSLHLDHDSIEIHYSISIPVTDVGIPANIKFDAVGNYRIYQ